MSIQKTYIFRIKLMGSYLSLEDIDDLEGFRPHHISKSIQYYYPKNKDYYSGKRFFKISRKHYKNDYEDGYLWGRYEIVNPLDIIISSNNNG